MASQVGPFTASAICDAGIVAPDARGLMPLAEARAWLRGRSVYQRGEGRDVNGVHALESDTSWAALLSLANADEFLREARRLEWKFDVRGMDNVAPVERFGEAVLPWLAEHVDAEGLLFNRPWCVLPCLLALDSPEAFDVVWRVRAPEWIAKNLARDWLKAHPEVGLARLGALAAQGDTRARRMLAARQRTSKQPAKKTAPAKKAGAGAGPKPRRPR